MTFTNTAQWIAIKRLLVEDRKGLLESLIAKDSDEVRGRIKQIDDILETYPSEIARKSTDQD